MIVYLEEFSNDVSVLGTNVRIYFRDFVPPLYCAWRFKESGISIATSRRIKRESTFPERPQDRLPVREISFSNRAWTAPGHTTWRGEIFHGYFEKDSGTPQSNYDVTFSIFRINIECIEWLCNGNLKSKNRNVGVKAISEINSSDNSMSNWHSTNSVLTLTEKNPRISGWHWNVS